MGAVPPNRSAQTHGNHPIRDAKERKKTEQRQKNGQGRPFHCELEENSHEVKG
jgi:hypothetical protein